MGYLTRLIGGENERASAMEACNLCTESDIDEPNLFCGHPLPCPRHSDEGIEGHPWMFYRIYLRKEEP